MNNNVVDSIIASVIFAVLSTLLGLILQALGLSAQASVFVALLTLLALVILFIIMKTLFPIYARRLAERTLIDALSANNSSDPRMVLKKKIVERVLQDNPETDSAKQSWLKIYENQEACEPYLRDAFRNAGKVKILTVRGEKYFADEHSLFKKILREKQGRNCIIQVLVLSPKSNHINDKLAQDLGQHSAEAIKVKMQLVLKILVDLENQNKNFAVRCYDETPNFKLLLFDDTMFVSAFIEPKNDQNSNMLRITREGTPLFKGLENHFDESWKHSVTPTSVLDGRA
jgi:hypothetical protein